MTPQTWSQTSHRLRLSSVARRILFRPLRTSRFLAAEIPNSTLIEFSGGYHAFWIERADESMLKL